MSREVPEGWRAGKFDTFITLQRGFDLPVQDRKQGTSAVVASNGQIGTHSELRISGPAVVTGRSGTLGKVFYISEGCWPLNTTLYVKEFHGNDPQFVTWFLKHFKLDRFGTGTGVPTLNRNVVHEVEVAFPPLDEQRRIAEILSSVDDAIAATRAVIEQTRKVKQGVLKRLLTKGIAHTRFKQTEIGEIPEAWEIGILGEVVCNPDGLQTGPFGSQLKAEEYVQDGIPVVMPRDLIAGAISKKQISQVAPSKAAQLQNHILRVGDIVFARRGDIGRFALTLPKDEGFLCGTGCLRARLNIEKVIPAFASAFLECDFAKEWLNNNAVGQTMLNLNTSIISRLPFALPPLFEQAKIVEAVDSFDPSLRRAENGLSQLYTIKSALMSDLLTGRKRVTDALPMAAE